MEKLNEYLQALLSTCSYELHLEPNKPPYVISDKGTTEVANTPLLGTQISMLIFPLIPSAVKQQLPNKPEIEFVYAHNLGNFNFQVKKSAAGFIVTIRPVLSGSAKEATVVVTDEAFTENDVEISEAGSELPKPSYKTLPRLVSTFSNTMDAASAPPTKPQQFSFEKSYDNPIPDTPPVQPFEERRMNYQAEAVQPEIARTGGAAHGEGVLSGEAEFAAKSSGNTIYNAQLKPQEQTSIQSPAELNSFSAQSQPAQHNTAHLKSAPSITEASAASITARVNPAHPSPASVKPQAQNKMDALFYKMAEVGASDLHLSVSMPPMVRKDGKMSVLEPGAAPLTLDAMKELLTSIMPAKNQEEFERRHDTDFAYEIENLARFRANIFMDRKGMGGVFRIIPTKILTAEQLGLSKAIMDLCNLSKGLVVVTGPTGSGKSTTLCAMIDSINKTREDHIITIEDPIEFTHENQKCLVNQREVHNHTDSFKDALRAALREDPDILLVGEMRDLETISIAIETAETGHLVFGTLHTTTAASTIDRIIDQFPADRQQQIRVMLSESLKGVIAQTLLPKKGGGRVAALEVLIVTPAISNLIREGKTFQIPSAMQTGKTLGMVMLNDALFELVKKGLVEPRDAYIKAVDKASFEALLTRNGMKI